MVEILQKCLPFAPWMQRATARLPGVQPVAMADIIQIDDAYAAQLLEKARLLAQHKAEVLAQEGAAEPAAVELLEFVLTLLHGRDDFSVDDRRVTRPDGVQVVIERAKPLQTLAALIQEDVAILHRDGTEHVLQGALICFPASWTLAEKIGRPLSAIHDPVESYSSVMARRVQRLFDAVRVDQPLMRANALMYVDPELFQPRRQGDAKPVRDGPPVFMRSERQTILRLPRTDAVAFLIHTYVVAWDNLTDAQKAGWLASGGLFDG